MRKVTDISQKVIWIAVALYAFLLPWGVTGVQIALGIAVLAWLVEMIAERRGRWVGRPVGWPVLVFVLLLAAASLLTYRAWRRESVRDLASFVTLIAIFLVATNLRDVPRLRRLALVLVGSLALFSLYAVSVRLVMLSTEKVFHAPLVVSKAEAERIRQEQRERVEAAQAGRVGEREPLGASKSGFWLADVGSMSEAGQLAMGLPIALALLLAERKRKLRWALLLALVLIGANLILNMKRGAWGACMAALVVFAVVERRRVVLAVLIALIAAMVIVKPSRERIVQAFAGDDGQRLKLWASVPKVVREWPLGVGPGCSYHVIQTKRLVPHAVYLAMPDKVHFHNTIAELAVTAGPLSVAAFLWWLAAFALWAMRRLRRTARDAASQNDAAHDDARPIILGGLLAATAFFVNGLFEYNLGDSDVTMMLYLAMGMAMAIPRASVIAAGPTTRSLSAAPSAGEAALHRSEVDRLGSNTKEEGNGDG